MTVHFDDSKSLSRIAELKQKEEEDLAKVLADRYGLQYIDLTGVTIDTDGLRLLPEDEARHASLAIFSLINKKIKVAIISPNRDETRNKLLELEKRGYGLELFMASTKSLEHAWSRYKDISFATESRQGTLEVSNDEIRKILATVKSFSDVKAAIEGVLAQGRAFRVSRIVEISIASAIASDASDVHVEPTETGADLRFRIDGVLIPVTVFDTDTYKLMLSRIKLLSGMKLNIKNNAQDGRFSIVIDEKELEIRSSILPGNNGESIVMRILDPKTIAKPISSLGMWPYTMEIIKKQIERPDGMILNTGPTGSGKTTALYAFLNKVKTPELKIITIEDPIEYHLPGIVQTQVDKKKNYDFASGLRASLRQDPDVIMVGEIRDKETAETAIHSALTGHLVFSTLHTNNAAGAYTRLIDLGVNAKILTSAIRVAIAQRLVRKLCDKCKNPIKLEGENLNLLKSIFDPIVHKEVPWTETIYEPVGCDLCNNTGYKGRVGIFEAVLSDSAVENTVENNPSEREIKKAAEPQGIADMAQDGVMKILAGMTSIDELGRVVDLRNREGL